MKHQMLLTVRQAAKAMNRGYGYFKENYLKTGLIPTVNEELTINGVKKVRTMVHEQDLVDYINLNKKRAS